MARDLCDSHARAIRAVLGERFAALIERLDAFDFDAAASLLPFHDPTETTRDERD